MASAHALSPEKKKAPVCFARVGGGGFVRVCVFCNFFVSQPFMAPDLWPQYGCSVSVLKGVFGEQGNVGWEKAKCLVAVVRCFFGFWDCGARVCVRACVQSEGSGSFHPSRLKLCESGGAAGSNTTLRTAVFCLDWEQWKHWHGRPPPLLNVRAALTPATIS